MRSFWRPICIAAGFLAALAGTLMLMGNVRQLRHSTDSLEFTKLQATAAIWEAGLESSRSTVREQILRNNLLRIAEHPTEWAAWRAAQNYDSFIKGWNSSYGP